MTRRTTALGALGALLCTVPACVDYLEPGEVGQMRYIDDVRGAPPLRMRAPISDREGNMYALYGGFGTPEVAAYGGGARGSWKQVCNLHENPQRSAHGWIGNTENRVWYWSGDALVDVSLDGCYDVLDFDPSTAADIAFKAVIPWIRETPSRMTTVAMIQSPGDPTPFFGVLELDQNPVVYSNLNEFVPREASTVQILGVGAAPEQERGFIALRYSQGETARAEIRFLSPEAAVETIAPLQGVADLEQDSVTGFMQMNDAGWGAGALRDGRVLVFNESGGGALDPAPLQPTGVHKWGGNVYVVGINGGRPAVALLAADGRIASPEVWQTSEQTLANLQNGLEIMDNRFQPVDYFTWPIAQPAIGAYPFLHPNSPTVYAQGTALLTIAGPTFMSGGEPFSPIAVGPVGLSYP